ncbi:MAG: two-component system, chemotaxis family, chemotaxis protein CheY [Betaproteobacteria bacterium]|jgi:DNA-binding response OmpR family regulator|nr:two-component system, chemotaxis family, chemotaxis protein CheY [Betaproteobacteria bacterium]
MTPRILVVDDDASLRELLGLHLSNAGYEVVVAEDAVAAGHALLKRAPTLMLIDVDMPYMNGFEFVAAVKAEPGLGSIPVLFLTARDDVDERARKVGAAGCLKKPLFANELIAAVAAIAPSERFAIG